MRLFNAPLESHHFGLSLRRTRTLVSGKTLPWHGRACTERSDRPDSSLKAINSPCRAAPCFGKATASASIASLPRDSVAGPGSSGAARSEEHTSELQSQSNLVCRLLLEKK